MIFVSPPGVASRNDDHAASFALDHGLRRRVRIGRADALDLLRGLHGAATATVVVDVGGGARVHRALAVDHSRRRRRWLRGESPDACGA